MHKDCINCYSQQAGKLFKRYAVQDEIAGNIIERFRLLLEDHKHNNYSTPEASRLLHRLIREVTGRNDPYKKEKNYYNNLLLGLEKSIGDIIKESGNPFRTALKYALAGNIIDFGPPGDFNVFEALSSALSKEPVIDHSDLLHDELQKASTVLYLGDNAGEIILDKLFIETIGHPDLYFAVRGDNIINDVTVSDAEMVGMTKVAKVIPNGYDAPSTIVKQCSPDFRKIYYDADIIISKGQGNLEGLLDEVHKKIFFLLMVKCNVMAEWTGVNEGDVIILFNQSDSFTGNEFRKGQASQS